MKPSLRYSILTVFAVLCLGVVGSGTALRLPAFSRGAAMQDQPAALAANVADDPEREIARSPSEDREAIVQTDRSVYAPGELIIVTGSGWDPGETVTLLLQGGPTSHSDRKVSVVADAFGNIFDNQFRQEGPEGGVTFSLTATGKSSGLSTQAAFGNPSANLDQWANLPSQLSWVNGNLGGSKAKYFEGDSIPYRLTFGSLSLGSHTVTIEWDTTKSSKHALDYITTFDRTPPLSGLATDKPNPCTGVSNPACGAASTFPIPVDPQVIGANPSVTPIAGNFTIYGGTITAVSAYSYANGTGFAGDKTAKITITFTASQTNPVLAWGGHISTRLDWGALNSCVTISGSPYHTRLLDLDGSGGNQDRSLSSDAVVFPGSITVVKHSNQPDSTQFTFSITPPTGAPAIPNFTLTDNSASLDPQSIAGNLKVFGNYSVSESAPTGWSLDTIACVDNQTSLSVGSVNKPAVTIGLTEGQNVTCTFTNSGPPVLIVQKLVINDNGGTKHATDFSFSVDAGGAVAFTQDGADVLKGKNTVSHSAGSFNVTEPAVTGYGTSYSGCSGTIANGETKTCTITNDDQAASLIVQKLVINDNGGTKHATDFSFSVDAGGAVAFTQDGADVLKGKNTVSHSAGSFNVTEPAVTGYGTSYSGCSGTIANGETKTCTITNDDQAASLIVQKLVINDNGGTKHATDFSFSVDAGGAVAFTQDGADVLKGKNTVSHSAGSFNVTEPAVTGYGTSYSGCSGTIANGETKTCTITNDDQAASLIVQKLVINDNGGTKHATDFSFSVDAGGAVAFTQDGADVLKGKNTVSHSAGSFNVTEPAVTGYGTSYSGCSGTIANGETKTCTITNDDIIASPSIATDMSWTLEDKAVLSNVRTGACNAAGATVTFTLYGPFSAGSFDPTAASNCTGTPAFTSNAITVANAASTGVSHGVGDVGIYVWQVHYSGDSCNSPQDSACNSEITEVKETNSIPPSQ